MDKKSRILIKMKFLEGLGNPRVWAGYLLGTGYAWFVSGRYIAFSGGRPVQIAEGFLVLLDRRLFISILMMGYFLIVADAPFLNQRVYLTMSRCGKKEWIRSILWYLLLQTVFYYSAIFGACMVSGMAGGYIQNVWSEPMDILSRIAPDYALLKYNLTQPAIQILNTYVPWEAAIHALLLICGYSYLLAGIAFLGNMLFSGYAGSAAMVLVYMVSVIMVNDEILYPIRISLLGNAMLGRHFSFQGTLSLCYSYLLFGTLNLILNRSIQYSAERTDFLQIRRGDRW